MLIIKHASCTINTTLKGQQLHKQKSLASAYPTHLHWLQFSDLPTSVHGHSPLSNFQFCLPHTEHTYIATCKSIKNDANLNLATTEMNLCWFIC